MELHKLPLQGNSMSPDREEDRRTKPCPEAGMPVEEVEEEVFSPGWSFDTENDVHFRIRTVEYEWDAEVEELMKHDQAQKREEIRLQKVAESDEILERNKGKEYAAKMKRIRVCARHHLTKYFKRRWVSSEEFKKILAEVVPFCTEQNITCDRKIFEEVRRRVTRVKSETQ